MDGGESLVVQGIREGQRDGRDHIIPVIADVRRAWHDGRTGRYLSDRVAAHACLLSSTRGSSEDQQRENHQAVSRLERSQGQPPFYLDNRSASRSATSGSG